MIVCRRFSFIAVLGLGLSGCSMPAPPPPRKPAPQSSATNTPVASALPVEPPPAVSASAAATPVSSASAIAETPPPPRVIVCADCNAHTIVQYVHFDHRQAKIRKQFESLLLAVRDILLEHPDIRMEIRGHIDASEVGHGAKSIGLARAEAVKKWFEQHGIDSNRMVTKDMGSTQPLRIPHSDADREMNRRVEFARVVP